ncbi:MAG TPA: medium chain dehydrogenase/reductase family protein [Candidatus Acidoferrum sp.]|jgi:NADPH:quinone reductase-like Zn-dependent oxidoreductase
MRNTRVVLTGIGGPEVLHVVADEVRDPGANEVRVRILACGVAFADVLMRRGLYSPVPPLPYSPGYDIAGVVESCGADVRQWKPGDVVAALTMTGGYSRYMVLTESELVRVPRPSGFGVSPLDAGGLDPAEVVSLILNYTTAYQLIHRVAKLKPGESVLIHGAAGGVGTAALQLGSIAGLKMFGTASKAKHELVAALGGIPIDYRSEDFVNRARGVNAVFDPIGGRNWMRSYSALGKKGRFVGYGMSAAIEGGDRNMTLAAASFAWLGLARLLPGKSARWYNISAERKKHPDWFAQDLSRLFAMLQEKSIAPVIAERVPLSDAGRAHRLLERASVSGKIVLMCQE